MLDSIVTHLVTGSLNRFFKPYLKDHYDKRRNTLNESNEHIIPVIDHILQVCTGNKQAKYPPECSAEWVEYYTKLSHHKQNDFLKIILLVYLELDIRSYASDDREAHGRIITKQRAQIILPKIDSLEEVLEKLHSLPHAFDFPNSVMHLATGLWAIDNEESEMAFANLSNPAITFADYFDLPKDVSNMIINNLYIDNQPRFALFMSKIHRLESWDENFDPIYALLLLKSDQLSEALKYERLFSERENYDEILEKFFRYCLEWNVTKALNCLNLSPEEEEMLNQHPASVESSRPVTPASGKHQSAISQPSKQKPTPRNIKVIRRTPSFNDSPARNTRLARKRKPVK